jgi:hypothetical protein
VRSTPELPSAPPIGQVARPPEQWETQPARAAVAPVKRPWAALVVCWSGVIVGTVAAFAPWAEYRDGASLTGVRHGDGWFVIVAAVAAAALVGALAVGWRHLAVRLGLVGVAVVLGLLFVLNRVDISRSEDRVTGGSIDVGGGLYGVAFAACLLVTGALIIPTRPRI